jgi:hypothetical protein
MSAPPFLPTERFSGRLEELRASLAADAQQRGLDAIVQRAILGMFEILLRMIMKWRDGALIVAPVSERSPYSASPHTGYESGAAGVVRAARPPTLTPRINPRVKPEDAGKPLFPRKGGGKNAVRRGRSVRHPQCESARARGLERGPDSAGGAIAGARCAAHGHHGRAETLL